MVGGGGGSGSIAQIVEELSAKMAKVMIFGDFLKYWEI